MHINPQEVDHSDTLNFLPSRMTVACERVGTQLKISAAYCSQGDQFSKRHGRELAKRKLSMNLDTYRERMGYYRQGRGTKPVGFHHTVNVEYMTDENWYNVAHDCIHDMKLMLLSEYNSFKTLHMERLEATEVAKGAVPVQG